MEPFSINIYRLSEVVISYAAKCCFAMSIQRGRSPLSNHRRPISDWEAMMASAPRLPLFAEQRRKRLSPKEHAWASSSRWKARSPQVTLERTCTLSRLRCQYRKISVEVQRRNDSASSVSVHLSSCSSPPLGRRFHSYENHAMIRLEHGLKWDVFLEKSLIVFLTSMRPRVLPLFDSSTLWMHLQWVFSIHYHWVSSKRRNQLENLNSQLD